MSVMDVLGLCLLGLLDTDACRGTTSISTCGYAMWKYEMVMFESDAVSQRDERQR